MDIMSSSISMDSIYNSVISYDASLSWGLFMQPIRECITMLKSINFYIGSVPMFNLWEFFRSMLVLDILFSIVFVVVRVSRG